MASPRRILLLVTDLEIGGTPTVVRDLAVRLHDPPRVHVEVACLAGHGPVVDQLALARIHATPLGAASPRDVGVIARLIALLRQRQFDTVLSFLVHANAAAAVAGLRLPSLRVMQSIQTTQPRPAWHWHVQQLAAMRAERVVVNTPSAAMCARRRSHIAAEKLIVIPNAIDPDAFAISARRADGLFRVGFIGRLDPVKRVDDLLRAARLLPRGIMLEIFGDGAERDRLHTLVHELGIGDRVRFHGTVARPQLALQQIDALVLPSEAEGFGLVLIEAMAAGVPVIGTNVPGICDVISADVNALLVPVRSPASLARAILQLRDDATLRERLVAAGRGAVADRYTFDRTIPRWRAVLGL